MIGVLVGPADRAQLSLALDAIDRLTPKGERTYYAFKEIMRLRRCGGRLVGAAAWKGKRFTSETGINPRQLAPLFREAIIRWDGEDLVWVDWDNAAEAKDRAFRQRQSALGILGNEVRWGRVRSDPSTDRINTPKPTQVFSDAHRHGDRPRASDLYAGADLDLDLKRAASLPPSPTPPRPDAGKGGIVLPDGAQRVWDRLPWTTAKQLAPFADLWSAANLEPHADEVLERVERRLTEAAGNPKWIPVPPEVLSRHVIGMMKRKPVPGCTCGCAARPEERRKTPRMPARCPGCLNHGRCVCADLEKQLAPFLESGLRLRGRRGQRAQKTEAPF